MVYGNTIISHINRKEYDEIIQKASGYLDFYIRHELWKFYYQINMQLITAYNLKGDYKQAAEAAELMFDRARKREDKAGMALALYATGITYNVQNRWERGRRMFQRVRRLIMGSFGIRQYPDTILCVLMHCSPGTGNIAVTH